MANLSIENVGRMSGGANLRDIIDRSETLRPQAGAAPAGHAPTGETGKDFIGMLKDSINQVNDFQQEAETSMQQLAAGSRKNIHETMMAMEKADVSFRMLTQVRNKIIDAYREIMRMGV